MGEAERAMPFLTVADPEISGEGALDPLGLGPLGERLAEEILPGLTNRMRRPRFLTAMAVSALVCEGLEEKISADGVSPAQIVFEWLVVEAFARTQDTERFRQTPGIEKARTAIKSTIALSAKSYLKTPTVFGFHGVYKRLARNLKITHDEFGVDEKGLELLQVWECEQGATGFSNGAEGPGAKARTTLRSAVKSSMEKGNSDRTPGWAGWEILEKSLAPGECGRGEATFIYQLLVSPDAAPRGEIFSALARLPSSDLKEGTTEASLARDHLMTRCSPDLKARLVRIDSYEKVCRDLEKAFEWARYASTSSMPRALSPSEYGGAKMPQRIAERIGRNIRAAANALDGSEPSIMQEYLKITRAFENVAHPDDLLQACLERHGEVQMAKPPEGKAEWFQKTGDGRVIVRPPYKSSKVPDDAKDWGRPYRLWSVMDFCRDLEKGIVNAS